MTSERIQRQVERLLDEADEAAARRDWQTVKDRAEHVLTFDPQNVDAVALLGAANRGLASDAPPQAVPAARSATTAAPAQPASFAKGRYLVKRFLGEGGKKRVYLAHDSLLDRDVAFALIKTEGLDDAARERITREAQAMGRLGAHPHIVTVFDIGEEPLQSPGVETPGMARQTQPYLVLPVLAGGDVEGVIEKALEHKLALEQAIRIAVETCQGLEFVHGKGIVHRDLKPGNVWLTEDGRAMIGDFGLAVAMDRTRLTQAGMMVGTVSYMPPEQAMGGEITPRSDLYALGAMLYEMVCGRPPFVGDESVAIIGQHLNTPPVAPAWHRPDCPPALEALILRLLEKDPSRRPESALEVRQALQAIGQAGSQPSVGATLAVAPGDGAGASPAPISQADPLYRRTFVGREHEVKQLQQAFDGAMSGNGALVMVVGEPGIGKTALCEQLATYVALRGGKALVGHCYEEGSLSLPYLAFVEAMRSYVLARDPDGLHSDLGTGAADVARIVSEVRDRVQGVELRPAGDPEDDRWRLLQAITGFLRNASTVQPLAIVLEDLHWADRGTLDLLLHVSRNLQGARLLIVGTYRDVEVDRTHPLSGTLAELRRQANFLRVPLRGLSVDEVHRMYEAMRGQVTPWAQAEAVYRQTEGNPLFIQEVLRYLVEEGIVVRQDGRWTRADGGEPGAGVPEGLRDVIGRRLSRLTPETNRVLAIAAVVGRGFNLATVLEIAGAGEDELVTSLDEAVRVGILEERGEVGGTVNYRFAHAFFRQTLYEELSAARRIRFHQQVGRALETFYQTRVFDHAAELAEHFSHSSDAADLAKAVQYGEAAAARAAAVFDYGEAERLLARALDVQEVLDPTDLGRRCDLLLQMGDVMLPQDNPRRIIEASARPAFALAESIGDSKRAVRAALSAFEAISRSFGIGVANTDPAVQEWATKADKHAAQASVERVHADIALSIATMVNSRQEAHGYMKGALELAIELGDAQAFFPAAGRVLQSLQALRDRDLLYQVVDETFSRSREGARTRDLFLCLGAGGLRLFERGRREQAESAWRDLDALVERTQDASLVVERFGRHAFSAYADGDTNEAVRLYEGLLAQASEQGVTTGVAVLAYPMVLFNAGRPIEPLLPLAEGPSRVAHAMKALLLAFNGRNAEVHVERAVFGDITSLEDETNAVFLQMFFAAAIIGEDRDTIGGLLPRLSPFAATFSVALAVSIGRLCGEGAILLGKLDAAHNYYRQALEVCNKLRFRPEIALIRLDLAELLLGHYPDERDAAIEHLDFAIAELRDMKMQPALERALRHRGLLKA